MLIELKNISKTYDNEGTLTHALSGVSFDVEEGEFVAIIGASGSGKSTLMHIVGLLEKPTDGQYLFDQEDTAKFDDQKLALFRNQKIGFIFQAYNLLPRTSVFDNVLLPTIYTPFMNKKQSEAKARELLAQVGLSHRINHRPNQLSGGEQQRVAIVRALINSPRLILADEPTGNLDSKSGQEVMKILQNLNEKGNTIIMVTHEQYVAECTKRILNLKDGSITSDTKVAKRNLAKDGIKK